MDALSVLQLFHSTHLGTVFYNDGKWRDGCLYHNQKYEDSLMLCGNMDIHRILQRFQCNSAVAVWKALCIFDYKLSSRLNGSMIEVEATWSHELKDSWEKFQEMLGLNMDDITVDDLMIELKEYNWYRTADGAYVTNEVYLNNIRLPPKNVTEQVEQLMVFQIYQEIWELSTVLHEDGQIERFGFADTRELPNIVQKSFGFIPMMHLEFLTGHVTSGFSRDDQNILEKYKVLLIQDGIIGGILDRVTPMPCKIVNADEIDDYVILQNTDIHISG